jgi:hypothetical protein
VRGIGNMAFGTRGQSALRNRIAAAVAAEPTYERRLRAFTNVLLRDYFPVVICDLVADCVKRCLGGRTGPSMRHHVFVHFGDNDDGPLTCVLCGYRVGQSRRRHIFVYLDDNGYGPLTCTLCGLNTRMQCTCRFCIEEYNNNSSDDRCMQPCEERHA